MPTPISELMQRDPLLLTKEDLTEIVAYYRAKREEAQAAPKRGAKKSKADAADLDSIDL